MEASRAPHLRAVPDGTNQQEIARQLRKGEVLCVDAATHMPVTDARDTIVGLLQMLETAGKTIGSKQRQLDEAAGDLTHDPAGKDITALIDLWKTGCNHPKAKAGKTRIKMVKARLADGYPLKADDEASLELAVIGLAAYPYRVFDRRNKTGRPSDRDDDLSAALKDEKHVENMARLGWKAKQQGFTVESGWPEGEGE